MFEYFDIPFTLFNYSLFNKIFIEFTVKIWSKINENDPQMMAHSDSFDSNSSWFIVGWDFGQVKWIPFSSALIAFIRHLRSFYPFQLAFYGETAYVRIDNFIFTSKQVLGIQRSNWKYGNKIGSKKSNAKSSNFSNLRQVSVESEENQKSKPYEEK